MRRVLDWLGGGCLSGALTLALVALLFVAQGREVRAEGGMHCTDYLPSGSGGCGG